MSSFCVCQMGSDSPLSAVPVFVDEIEHLLTVARQFGAEVLVVIRFQLLDYTVYQLRREDSMLLEYAAGSVECCRRFSAVCRQRLKRVKFLLVGVVVDVDAYIELFGSCILYTSPSPRDPKTSRMPSYA